MDELRSAREETSSEDGRAVLWFQLYLAKDRPKSEKVIKKALEWVTISAGGGLNRR
jgi:hypothetical protein